MSAPISKESWEAGLVAHVVEPESGEYLGYVPEHVYDRVVKQLQKKLKDHVDLLEQTFSLMQAGDFQLARALLYEARTRGV